MSQPRVIILQAAPASIQRVDESQPFDFAARSPHGVLESQLMQLIDQARSTLPIETTQQIVPEVHVQPDAPHAFTESTTLDALMQTVHQLSEELRNFQARQAEEDAKCETERHQLKSAIEQNQRYIRSLESNQNLHYQPGVHHPRPPVFDDTFPPPTAPQAPDEYAPPQYVPRKFVK